MPDKQKRRVTKRIQTDPRNTFDYSTPNLNPQANPIDSYVEPNAGNSAQQLAEALGVASDTMKKVQPFMKDYANDQYEKGRIAALTGKEKPTDGYYKITAYEEAQGDVTADTEYRKALQDYFTKNYNKADPEEFQKGLEELTTGFLKGRTDNFIRKFAPKAQELEEKVISNYHSYLAEEQQRKSLNIVGGLADTGINEIINSNLQQRYNDKNIQDLEDVTNNPEMFSIIQYDDTFKENLKSDLRSKLSEIQKRGLDMGLSRKQISSKFVEFLGRYAVRNGMPEVLDMAYEQDENGVSLAAGEQSNKIANFKQQANAARDRLILSADKAAAEKAEKQRNLYVNQVDATLMDLSLIEDPKKRAQKALELENKWMQEKDFQGLKNTTFRRIMGTLRDFQKSEFDFPDTSNEQVYAELYSNAIEGNLTLDTLQEMKNEGELALDDWKGLYKTVVEQKQAKLEDAQEWKDSGIVNDIIDETTNYLVEKQMGDFKDNRRAAGFKIMMYDAISDYKNENNGKGPDRQAFVKDILNPVLDTYNLSYGEIIRQGLGDTESPKATNVDLQAEQDKVEKEIQSVNEYQEDKENVGPIESILEKVGIDTGSRKSLFFKRNLPDLDTYSPMKWGYELEEANGKITQVLEAGGDVESIKKVWTESMKSEKAADFYLYNYLYDYSQNEFSRLVTEDNVSAPEALKAIKDRLSEEWNVPKDMLQDVMNGIGAQEESEVWNVDVGATTTTEEE